MEVSGNEISSKVVVSRKYEKAKSNFTRMFLTIIIVYLLSYAPTCVVLVCASLDSRFWILRLFSDLAMWFLLGHFYVINHTVNPAIYMYFDTNMRRKVVALFRKQKRSTEGVFEIQKSGDKTSSGEIGLDIRTHASPKVGQDQVSGGQSSGTQVLN